MEELAKGKACVSGGVAMVSCAVEPHESENQALSELNRTAASVASSNNGMSTFSTPSTQNKFLQNAGGRKK